MSNWSTKRFLAFVGSVLILCLGSVYLAACPFCSAINLTFAEQIKSNDVVVIAKLIEIPEPVVDPDAELPKSVFEITDVIKGNDVVGTGMQVRSLLVGRYPIGNEFLIMGVDPPNVSWSTPMKASKRVVTYLQKIQSLPKTGPKRLEFFQKYFEDKESVLAFDAYDEFAAAPYEDVVALKDKMDHPQLVKWIKDKNTSTNRRRLYLTMLGICGDETDIAMLEEFIKSGDRKKQAGLDALIAAYLKLKGEAGLDLIVDKFLKPQEGVEYVDTLAAVTALRILGTEIEAIPKDRIVAAMRTFWEAAAIDVAPPEITPGIDFFLETVVGGNGSISGQVTVDGADNEPIPGAVIYASLVGNPFYSEVAYADEDGVYTLSRLRPGEYIVSAEAEWFFGETYDNVPLFEQGEATPVAVVDGGNTSDINFALSRGGTISGQIVDQDGEPIVEAEVWAYALNEQGEGNPDYPMHYGYGRTDENGNYLVSGLFEGDYLVQVNIYGRFYSITLWYDNADRYEDATPVPVVFGENTPGIDFNVDVTKDTGSLSGSIGYENGAAVLEAQVRLESLSDPNFYYYISAYPDADGMYRFDEVPVGTYRVALEYWTDWYYRIIWYEDAISPENATPVEVVIDQETENINFILPESDGEISGVVTDENGTPIPNAYIQLSADGFGHPYQDFFFWGYATTDNEGRYTIPNIPDGEFYVSVFYCSFFDCIQRWWPEAEYPEMAEPVVVTDGATDPPSIDFKLPVELGTATISGTVVNQDGTPLTGANISVMPYEYIVPGDTDQAVWTTQMYTVTDSSGFYSFNTLPAGTYLMYASYWGEGSFDEQWYEGVSSPTEATHISVDDNGVVENIDFKLDVQPLYGTLYGQAFLEDGTPVDRGYIKVYPLYEESYNDIAFWAEWYAVLNDDGSFVLDALPAGEYSVSLYAQGASQIITDATGTGMEYIRIEGGQRTEAEFLMRRQERGPATLSGLVQGEQGDQLEISVVLAVPATDGPGEPFYTAVADEDGSYTFDGLPEGAYFVQAMAPWHMTEYYDDVTDPERATLVQATEVSPAQSIDFTLSNMYYIASEPAEADLRGSAHASTVKGYVLDDNSNAISGATVYVLDEAGEALLSTETRHDGSYQIFGIPPGESYRIKATHAGYTSAYNDDVTALDSAPALTMNNGSYELNFTLSSAISTDVDRPGHLPNELQLTGNYPNPFSTQTSISLTLPERMHVTVAIYDVLGREVYRLTDGVMREGSHTLTWDVSDTSPHLPSGLYFYRVSNGKSIQSGSMTYYR